jgi:hypothetical protein
LISADIVAASHTHLPVLALRPSNDLQLLPSVLPRSLPHQMYLQPVAAVW